MAGDSERVWGDVCRASKVFAEAQQETGFAGQWRRKEIEDRLSFRRSREATRRVWKHMIRLCTARTRRREAYR